MQMLQLPPVAPLSQELLAPQALCMVQAVMGMASARGDHPLPPPKNAKKEEMAGYYCVNCAKKGYWVGHDECKYFVEANNLPKRKADAKRDHQRRPPQQQASGENTVTSRAQQTVPVPSEHNLKRNDGNQHKQPKPADQTRAPAWIADKQRDLVSGPKNGGTWEKIRSDTFELFGQSMNDMMSLCNNLVVDNAKIANINDRKLAFVNFFLSLSG